MTVSYQYEVASSTSGGFTRLLFMWKGSLYKLIYRELLLFLAAFAILSALYRNAFTEEQKRLFERMVVYCDAFTSLIPLSFVLGFYVQYVAVRWWSQYLTVPWPDKIMHSIALYVSGNDEHGRMLRRTMMRYLNLSLILVLRSISSAVKRRFPTLDHLVEAGFMTKIELEMYKAVPSVEFNTYWIPCTWFINLLKETKRENRITDSQGLKIIMEEFNEFRSKCGMLWSYDWVSIPLVYTQAVTIATYSFFLAALVGRQYVEKNNRNYQMEVDIYIPIFTILQFFFYMGLLKVAEQLINPFGDDDEDFELNWIIDRHTKVSYLGVDILMSRSPPLVKDKYFDELDLILPYTEASVSYKKKTYRGSVHDMEVPEEKHTMFLPEITEEDEDKDSISKGSIQNVKVAGVGATASTTAAAAGIWRSKFSSTQNLFKFGDTKETDPISVHCMEEGLAHPSEIKVSEVSWRYAPPKEHGFKIVKPLARSESAPGRKPSFTMNKWPSSSTICQSDSFRLSEISIEVDESEQGINSPQRPKQSSLAYEKPKPHSFSGADFPNQKPGISPFSTVDSKCSSVGRRRAVLGKIRSLPKLIPSNRHHSMGSAEYYSRLRKGVRWKTLEEYDREKYVGPHTLEFEKMYGRGLQSDALSVPGKFNSLETPEIKFASTEFPGLRSNPNEVIYCDMCKTRIQRISVSPNPEAVSIVCGVKHCYSAPVLTNDQTGNCNRDRSHSWQNKIFGKMKNEAKRKEMIPLNELQNKLSEVNSTFISNSAPCLSFWDNSLLSIKYPELDDNGLKFGSLVGMSKEKTEVNCFPPSNSITDATPIKTFFVPNPELEMDTSSPPTSRKSSDVLNESSQDVGSWKSADWTTLLGTDLSDS